jgi:prephenate dehydrogenase
MKEQTRAPDRQEGAMGAGQPAVGIIGGTGRMGTWFSEFMEQRGISVLRTGRGDGPHGLEEVVGSCRVMVVSVPIRKTLPLIRRIGPMMPETSLLMDLTSVKEAPLVAMVAYSRSEVVGLHPLFGPGDESARKRKMVICRGRGEQGLRWIRGLLRDAGIEPLIMGAAEHDRLMGIIQGANHLATLALALSMKRSGVPLEQLIQCATPVFMERLERVQAMLGQPSELFSALMMENPYAGDCLKEFTRSAEEWRELVVNKDEKAFADLFDSLRGYY